MRVLIVGAGPTGLTAAVELARRGTIADVIDRRDAASSFSRAVGILPYSLEILQPSGVTDKLLAEGIRYRSAKFYNGVDNILTLPIRSDSRQSDYDFLLGLAQDRTEGILKDAFVGFGGAVRYETELIALTQFDDQVIATTRGGDEAKYDYVLGADGIKSTTRDCIGYDYPGFDLPETWSIADVDVEGWPNPTSFTNCLLPHGEVVIVVPLEAKRYRIISNTADALETLPLDMTVTNVRREGQFKISVRQVDSYQKGHVFLAGDAAHCHSPAGGRGMNLGISDSADFARRLVDSDLDGYTAARHAEGEQAIGFSERGRKAITSPNPLVRGLVIAALKIIAALPFVQRRVVQTLLYG